MASLMEEIADALARDTLRVVDETGDEDLIALVGRTIGASSTTTQEAFTTAVRVRIAEERARRLLAQRADDDWPLKPYAPGGGTVVMTGAVPALPAPMPAPREPRRTSIFDGPPLPPDEPPMGHEPIIEDEEDEDEPEVEPEPAPVAEEPPPPEPPPDDGRIRPRRPGGAPREVAAAAPVSIEAALALATSLPRKPLAEVEKPKADPLYPDVEIPDGDWG